MARPPLPCYHPRMTEADTRRHAKTLVVGGTGATGKLLIDQLLERGGSVRTIVRARDRLPEHLQDHADVEVIEATLLDLTDEQLAQHVSGCSAIASCLGHNLSFKGIFGPPWRLVTQAVKRLCAAARAADGDKPVRFVLMGSSGVRNGDLEEPIPIAQHAVLGLLRVFIQPHRDNETAAKALRIGVGPDDPAIAWCVVRPDGLIDEDEVGPYDMVESPTRSAIFDAGQVARIQVAHAMAELITNDDLFATWRGRMPVLYGRDA